MNVKAKFREWVNMISFSCTGTIFEWSQTRGILIKYIWYMDTGFKVEPTGSLEYPASQFKSKFFWILSWISLNMVELTFISSMLHAEKLPNDDWLISSLHCFNISHHITRRSFLPAKLKICSFLYSTTKRISFHSF